MDRPIVVVHRGNPEYLALCLHQARKFNPASPLVLLGDESNAGLVGSVERLEHERIVHSGDMAEFERNYVHRSGLSVPFELFCFQRWFVLRDLMRRRNWDRCLHIDSDVLLFSEISQSGKRFDRYSMSLAKWNENNRIGHTNFVNAPDFLQAFCDFLFELYSSKEYAKQLDEILASDRYKAISDMTALELFRRRHVDRVGDLCEIVDDSAFDDAITRPGDYERGSRWFKRDMKRIRLEQGVPRCRHLDGPQEVRFCSIHFHGPTKYMMKYYSKKKIDFFGMFCERVHNKTIGKIFKTK